MRTLNEPGRVITTLKVGKREAIYYHQPITKKAYSTEIGRSLTTCVITNYDQNSDEIVIEAVGSAVKNPEDTFDHCLGMEIALRRALQQIPKSERMPFYFHLFQTLRLMRRARMVARSNGGA